MDIKDILPRENQDCYVVACGPSLKNYSKHKLQEFLKDKLVIAIKQGIELAPNADFHLVNDVNYTDYNYLNNTTILYCQTNLINPPPVEYNIKFTLQNYNWDMNTSLSNLHNFDDFTFDKTGLIRPWGPGIFYELGIYLCVHLKVKKIITLGWDVNNLPKHFYKNMKLYPDRRQNDPSQEEANLIISSTFALQRWLLSKSVEIVVGTINSSVSESIPREYIPGIIPLF